MAVRIEFYGVPRHRAGVEAIEVEAATLGTALAAARRKLPGLTDSCDDEGRPCRGILVSLGGREFVSDPARPLNAGDTILVLSSDAGG
jgi:molybdopterin converting factor small subunit